MRPVRVVDDLPVGGALVIAFCVCGRRWAECDGSRAGCTVRGVELGRLRAIEHAAQRLMSTMDVRDELPPEAVGLAVALAMPTKAPF